MYTGIHKQFVKKESFLYVRHYSEVWGHINSLNSHNKQPYEIGMIITDMKKLRHG